MVSDSLIAVWIKTIALVRTLCESRKSLVPVFKILKRHMKDDEIRQEAKKAAEVYSTFSYEELKEISRRLDDCKNRFMLGLNGKERSRCICKVLNDVMRANGGRLPQVDEWQKMYDELGCDRYV